MSDRGKGIVIADLDTMVALTDLDNANSGLLTAAVWEAAGLPPPIGSFMID